MIHRSRNQSRAEAIANVVAEYERSGLTRRSFSEQAGIAMSTLDYWRRRVRDRSQSLIVPVKIEPDYRRSGVAGDAGFRMSLPNGVRIESGWEFSEQGMACLLRLAREQ